MTQGLQDLTAAIGAVLSEREGQKIGIAVSGGGDSIALLRLVASARTNAIYVYTVDHALRAESATEAQFVADLCDNLGVPCRILRWSDSPRGNVSAAARAARYGLIAQAAKSDDVGTVMLAHTQDDQAETVLMALTRKAGVDGLSAMPDCMSDRGIFWLRPLLEATRTQLRAYLQDIGQDWIDDPTNDDRNYERVRMRQAQEILSDLGLSNEALAAVARNMQSARMALEVATEQAWQTDSVLVAGAVKLDRTGFSARPQEIQRRILQRACHIAAPLGGSLRKDPLMQFLTAPEFKTASVGGCLILVKPNAIWVTREPAAVGDLQTPCDAIWDGKWQVFAQKDDQNTVIRALGEDGLNCFPEWRELDIPRHVLLTTPSVWLENRLIAAPLIGQTENWSAKLI